jgi:hypothetical protein
MVRTPALVKVHRLRFEALPLTADAAFEEAGRLKLAFSRVLVANAWETNAEEFVSGSTLSLRLGPPDYS